MNKTITNLYLRRQLSYSFNVFNLMPNSIILCRVSKFTWHYTNTYNGYSIFIDWNLI